MDKPVVTIDDLMTLAKMDSEVSGWPYGESTYRDIRCKYNPEANRYTFTVDYKRASKAEVIKILEND